MAEMGIDHHVQGEAEARLMKTAQGPSRVACNVQSAVDAAHGLMLHHEVTQDANDTCQLVPMVRAAPEALGQEHLTVVAGAGYSNGEQLAACAGMRPERTLYASQATLPQPPFLLLASFVSSVWLTPDR